MSTPPVIPPRPARAQNSPAQAPSSHMDAPKVPPRPKRGIERSVSPHRDTYAPSPLNDPSYLHNGPPPKDGSRLTADVPSRPPSVSLPSLGEEGNEYASYEDLSKTLNIDEVTSAVVPQQTKNVAGDLPLHAPTASVPSSTAKSRIQLVTRTDSSQAEAAGFGKQLSVDDKRAQSTKSGQSGSSLGSRPSSLYNDKDEHGIPEIGVQVPMFRNAGDVQAPSPAPYAQEGPSSGVGFHHKPGGRHHGRTKSGREIFQGPPGSYGMHGHGVISNNEFEQKWYEKHPEDLKREKAGEYGPHIQENRKDYHWGADNLEKLVHAKTHDIGVGTSREAIDTPDEQIGYMASDKFASRMTSPRLPVDQSASMQASHPGLSAGNKSDEQVNDDDEVIHIDHPTHRTSKIHGGGYDPPTEDLGSKGGNSAEEGGWVTERGYGMPILASDELKKRGPEAEWRQPAISPETERHGDEYTVNEDGTPAYITKAQSHSRNSSRNRSNQAQRVIPSPSHYDGAGTPLQPHKEYEPLFPEDEDDGKKPETKADKLKRPNLARHHFPSQDVWEDTPGSLQLETTVETPQAPEESENPADDASTAKAFESAETEEQRKTDMPNEDQPSFLSGHKSGLADNKHLGKVRDQHPIRPGIGQRFPSQDIWEDAPSHDHLETTVSAPQTEEANEYAEESPVVEKPVVPARPTVPARPLKKEISPTDKKAAIMPERPKPQVPARPSKPSSSLERTPTNESQAGENDAPQAKAKPPVPARPGGSKIAALQAGFLKDLNSKLGLGPPAPKVKEPEPEQREEAAAPLVDARKGRAKGPQRRKPAASPVPAATITAEVAVPRAKLDFAPVTAIWSLNEKDDLVVPAAEMAAQLHESLPAPGKSESVKTAEDVVDKPADGEPEEATLSKTATKDSEKAAEHETILSKVTSALEAPLSKMLATVEPSEALATEKVDESVDVPGAFPLSEPSVAKADDATISSDVSLEEKPSAKAEEKVSKDVEPHTTTTPPTAAPHTATESSTAPETQS